MKLTNRFSFFALVTIFVLLLSLLTPAIAFADDVTPPPDPTEEPVQPPADTVATEEPALPPTDEATSESAPVEEDTTVAEVLDQLPEDTELVVVNEEGETVPLASQEAVDILSDSDTDPMWCPAGVTTVTSDCVAKNTVTLLLAQLAAKSGAGVIYFKASPNYNTNDVVFDQITNVANLGNLTDLTLQGGWDGTTTLASTITYSGQSVFTVPVTLVWNYNVTVNNFTVQNAASTGLSIDNSTAAAGDVAVNDSVFKKTQNGYDGLDVQSGGDITLANVTATNNTGMGSSLDSTSGSGDVSVSDSTFNDNSDDGLQVYSNSSGEVDVNNATANRNGNNGAYLSGGGEVNLTGTNTFDANNNNGLNVGSIGDINLNNVEANRNGGGGSYLDNCAWDGSTCTGSGDINLTGTNTFNANGISGLEISSTGDINLNNIDASRNTGGDGAYLDNTNGSGSIYFTGSNSFNDNEDSGLEAYSYGDITFDGASDTNANRNGESGLYLYVAYGGPANITLNNITANFNGDHGVYAYASDDLTLTNGYFKGNDRRGVYAQSDYGNIDISLSQFINDGMSGLRAEAYNWSSALGEGNITLDQVFSEKNSIHGANLGAAGGITIRDDSEFINNDESGVHIMGLLGSLFVYDSLFSDNDKHGVDAEFIFGNATIDNSVFTWNKKNGLNLPDVSGSINVTGSDFLNNKHDGAYLYNCGCTISDIIIDSSNFNDNGWSGLEAYSYGAINLIDVTADGNLGGDGAYLDNTGGTGDILVDPSEFNNNSLYGLEIYTNGDIDLSEVTADGNGNDGVYLDTSGSAKICDSTFNTNGGFGVNAANVAGTLTLGNISFSGNFTDYTYGGSNLVTDCNPAAGGGGGGGNNSVLIPVTGGEALTCDGTAASLTVKLSNGDHVILPCPINEFGVVGLVSKDGLPGALGDGNEFISGLSAMVIRGGAAVEELEAPMVISFLIPDGLQGAQLAILHWDGTQWVEIEGHVSSDGLHFEASTNLTGTFVLVKK